MDNKNNAAAAFERRLSELQENARPSHIGINLKEAVLYEKLLQLEQQLKLIESRLAQPVLS